MRGALLSISVSTRERCVVDPFDFVSLNRAVDIELAWMVWGEEEPDTTKIQREIDLAWTVYGLNKIAAVQHSRRVNPAAHSMSRVGKKYKVRTNHGTKGFYASIKADNSARKSWRKGSCRAVRKYVRLEAECRNPRTVNRAYKELMG